MSCLRSGNDRRGYARHYHLDEVACVGGVGGGA
jgi:hypothetical protein